MKLVTLLLLVAFVVSSNADYPGRATDLKRLEASTKQIQKLIRTFMSAEKAALSTDTAPQSCEALQESLDMWNGIDCADPPAWTGMIPGRTCNRAKTNSLLALQSNYDIQCSSNSATPSASVAPAFPDAPGCGCLDNAEYFNTLVFGNYDASSDVQGRLAVGGNASMSAFSIGDQLDESYGTEDYLVVKGHMTYITGRVYGGNIVYGDETSEIGDSIIHGLLRANTIRYDPDRVDFDMYQEYYQTLSTALCTLDNTGEIMIDNGHATTTRGNNELEILSMTCDEMDALLSIDFGGVSDTESVLINMRGESCQFLIEQVVPNPQYVIYNFCDAKRVGIEGVGVQGSILAPFADAISNSGVVYGQSVTLNWQGHAQQNEMPCLACLPFTPNGVLHPSMSPTPSVTPSVTPTATSTPEPSTTNSPTPTPEPSTTNSPTPTPEPSTTNSPTPTPEPSTTNSPTPTPEPSTTAAPSTTPAASSSSAPSTTSTAAASSTPAPSTEAIIVTPPDNVVDKPTFNGRRICWGDAGKDRDKNARLYCQSEGFSTYASYTIEHVREQCCRARETNNLNHDCEDTEPEIIDQITCQ